MNRFINQHGLAKSVISNLNEIKESLDPGIKRLVLVMREVGFNTISSCEGHFRADNFKHVRPNIIFTPLDRGLLHAWIREISQRELPLSIHFFMFPVWNPEIDVVHEDNWALEMDASWCETSEEAEAKRDETVNYLCIALQCATANRPLANDSFMRSRW